MFYAESGNNEFIELYNLSSTSALDLNNYRIKIYTSNEDLISDAGFGTLLPPHSYAVIFEGDYDLASGLYAKIIPQKALILKISDNAFGSSGMSNTSDRTVYLINSNDDTIDSCSYTADNTYGISEEKVIPNRDASGSNWSSSLRSNGTPGFKNSITPSDFDLRISSVSILPPVLLQGDDAFIHLIINNSGRNSADVYEVEIFNDLNKDSSGTDEERIFLETRNNLSIEDSNEIIIPLVSLETGVYCIICRIDYQADEDLSNNVFFKTFYVFPPGNIYNDIVINEIMYAPSAGEPEWIEIFNRSQSSVNLKSWRIGDNSTWESIHDEVIIEPGSFLVISKDSAILNFYSIQSQLMVINFPSLNNSGDAVVIKDSLGFIIDSLEYLPEWGGTAGNSLERIDPENSSQPSANWSGSLNKFKATPGCINSISKKYFDLELSEIIFNPIYPVFGDNISISAKVKNLGKSAADFSLILSEDINLDSIPDIELENVNSLELSAGDSTIIKFNYSELDLQSTLNFYVIIISSHDQDTSNNYLIKNIYPGFPVSTIVINEIMYIPVNGEPEWMELYNTAETAINLKNWSVSDVLTVPSSTKISEDIYIPGKSFLVISKDSAVINYHRLIPSRLLILNFPNLNNEADGIVIRDSRHLKIDSVRYESEWGKTGHSLERISISAGSGLHANWTSSIDLEMSTPGRINTAAPKLNDVSLSEIFFNPRFPVQGEDVFVHAKIKNNGSFDASAFSVNFFLDSDLDGIFDHDLGPAQIPLLISGDSAAVSSQNPIMKINSKVSAAVEIIFSLDEDTLNNYAEKRVEPGFSKNSLLINEIMFDPDQNEPEWIEIINASPDSVNLINWSVSDILPSPGKNFITNEDFFISPNEIFIIAKDTSILSIHPDIKCKIRFSSFGTLGNTADGIMIYDFRNAVIDSVLYKSSWGNMKGYSLERISLSYPAHDSSNWTNSLSVKKSTPGFINSIIEIPEIERNSLAINEIMFDPDIDNCEFVEFYNQSEAEINIGGWKIEDQKGNFSKLCETNFIVPANSFFTVFADSVGAAKYNLYGDLSVRVLNCGDLGLSNTDELIMLKDLKGRIIDSVWYYEKWYNRNFVTSKNRSLERINPKINSNDEFNWSSSTDLLGATPGKRNSIFTENIYSAQAKISVSPNPFSPDGDGFEDFTILNYQLSKPTSQVRVKIFDSRGRLIKTLQNNHAAGLNNSVIFNGLEDNGTALRMGIYIIYLEALNENYGTTEILKTTIVVARKLN